MVTFIGESLLIILDPGVTEVSATDLYSRWKDWQISGNNLKFYPAFRAEGGSPLIPGLSTGAYIFLQNQYGWRIRPPEQDITISLQGNLVAEDLTLPVLVPTLGDYSVLITGLQPVTQGVNELITQMQVASDFARIAASNTQPS